MDTHENKTYAYLKEDIRMLRDQFAKLEKRVDDVENSVNRDQKDMWKMLSEMRAKLNDIEESGGL